MIFSINFYRSLVTSYRDIEEPETARQAFARGSTSLTISQTLTQLTPRQTMNLL
jgi:hypothetical protein